MNQGMKIKIRHLLLKHEEKMPEISDDAEFFYRKLKETFYFYKHLNEARQIALIDICFIGWQRFLTLHKMISALSIGDYDEAACEVMRTLYCKQVPSRANEISYIIKTGNLDYSPAF